MLDNHIYTDMSSPQAVEHLLRRPGIESLLIESFKKPLTTVVAGAGYGKTQAVLAALKRAECKSSWVQLSRLDNNPTRFWERIAYAFACSKKLFDSLISLGYPESITSFDQFLRLLAREITQKEHFILVFDDFHLIDNKTILNFIELFISVRVRNFSIVIISRTKPELSLTGMMSKGLLANIIQDDLRFSRDEMDMYFHQQGIDINKKMSRELYAYTDGWILAIYLVGLVIKKGGTDNQNPILAVKIDIFDLIEKEIFSSVSTKLQDFLIKISVLEAIPSGLLNELAGDDPSLFPEMLSISLIRYDAFSDSYCIQHLFREFLMKKAAGSKEEEFREVYLTAAEWYIKNNCKFEAIEHYRKCNLYHEIFNIILSITHHVPAEVADFFIELIEQAPEEMIKKQPVIQVAKARYMYNNNRIEEAKRELTNLREKYEALPETEQNRSVLGEVYLLLAFISIIYIDYEFETLLIMADRCLPGGSRLVDSKTSLAEGVNICSIRDPAAGSLKRHRDALFNVAPYASRVTNGCSYGLEYLNAAEACLYTGELKNAEKYAYEAIYKSRQYQQYNVEYMANFVLIRILTAKGNYPKISELLSRMEEQLEALQLPSCIPLYDIINGWFHVKIGKTDKVAKWLKYEEETRKIFPSLILGREYLVRSDGLLAEERCLELLAFMEQTDRMYEDRGILFARIQNKITRAIIHHYMGHHDEAVNVLHESYQLSNPNELVMQYIEYGNQMRTLIHAARKNTACKIPREWLDKIYTKSSTYAKQLAQVVSAYNQAYAENTNQSGLSKRESQVLTYLCRGLTREEIAESCYLAVGTVNDILNNIYTKLGASNAADAARIANEKNLL